MRTDFTDCHFSLTEAARYLGKSPRWFQYQLSGPNPPPGYQVPSGNPLSSSKKQKKTWLFKKSDLDRWLSQFRAGSDLDRIVDGVMRELGAGK